MTCSIVKADCLEFLRDQPADSLDLVFGSPPYEEARLYLEGGVNLGVSRKTEIWVKWMVEVYQAAQIACKGLVAFVVAGQTRKFKWSAGPVLLMADLHRAGMNLRNPPIFHRVGIPGSGGPDWLRGDYEFIVCTSRPGKLPWSDNTSAGHPPKWAPGGAMSYRNAEGERKNDSGYSGEKPSPLCPASGPGDLSVQNGSGLEGGDQSDTPGTSRQTTISGHDEVPKPHKFLSMSSRGTDGERKIAGGRLRTKGGSPKDAAKGRRVTRGVTHLNGDTIQEDAYAPPPLANPGNIISLNVGGGVMGNELCHQNEAPFPEKLAEFFVLSFCPPAGTVCDPFSGSGTVAAVSVRNNRNFIGCDLRQSQVDLGLKRVAMETPSMFAE